MGPALLVTKRKEAELMESSSIHLGQDAVQNSLLYFSASTRVAH